MKHHRFARRITRISLLRQLITAVAGRYRRLIRGHIRILSITRRIIHRIIITARRLRQRTRTNRKHARIVKRSHRRRLALAPHLLSVLNRLIRNPMRLNRLTKYITSQRPRTTTLPRLPNNVRRTLRKLIRLTSGSPHQNNK